MKRRTKMKNVKVIIWGLGAMGGGIANMLLKKKGVDIVGAVEIGDRVGKSMFDLPIIEVERGDRDDVIMGSVEDVIKPGAADVVIVCTDSFTKDVFPKLKLVMENGMNVITSAEQMAYPAAQEPELAKQLDEIAKANGVSVLGTGINPGHIMDLLVLVMTGCMVDVEHILSKRVNSLSPFGPTVMEEQGIGISKEEFEARKADGTMAGHVGFAESVGMMADGLGLTGVAMVADAKLSNGMEIRMEHPQQIEPEQVGINTGDYVIIEGTPAINMVNSPEVEGGLGTIAMIANSIPNIINAEPGLQTMITMPIPCAIMGDMRNKVREDKKIVK